ncbi:hypothetical protein BST18_10005 [Mycobacteroides abscessus subsp. bolletii]|nr:hypothetical protein BST18_10005 [Mycobacteroides abscessus subsp. bolletii]
MSPRSVGRTVLARAWMPLVAAIALGVASVSMWKVHQMSAPEPVITVNPPQAPPEFTPKTLTYEVFGTPGEGGMLSYVDIDGHPHQENVTTLPWSHTETTTLTVVSGSISVQVRGGQVGCRIRVNDVVRDQMSDDHADANVMCRVKSA